MEAFLLRNCFWFEISKLLIAVSKNEFMVLFIRIISAHFRFLLAGFAKDRPTTATR